VIDRTLAETSARGEPSVPCTNDDGRDAFDGGLRKA
jgi:hypothetical protein